MDMNELHEQMKNIPLGEDEEGEIAQWAEEFHGLVQDATTFEEAKEEMNKAWSSIKPANKHEMIKVAEWMLEFAKAIEG
jgi:hypothetical protein